MNVNINLKYAFASFLLFIIGTNIVFAQSSNNQSSAQNAKVQPIFLGTWTPQPDSEEFLPSLSKARNNNESDNENILNELKKKLNAEKSIVDVPQNKTTGGTLDPVKVNSFQALNNQGTPSDNSIAMGKNGLMLAAVNSAYRVYNSSGGTGGTVKYYANIFSGVSPTNNICDPLVLYDPVADRFIIFGQTCDGSPTNSRLLMAFSASNDPAGAYHFYAFPTNLNTIVSGYTKGNVWFDYPKMAVSQSDVFVSGNMFNSSDQFIESALFQINKSQCYNGTAQASINALVWYAFPSNPFTLVPVNHGRNANYGDKMYVMASKNGGITQSYSIALYEVTGNATSNPTMKDNYISVPGYSPPADAIQKGSTVDLNTGDARGMSAIWINNVIHFVFHSNGPGNFSAINYNRVYKDGGNNWVGDNKLISIPNVECSFPSIASMGWTDQDQSVLINFNYSSAVDYPGMKCIFIDNNWGVSLPIELTTGTSYVSYLNENGPSGLRTRWGDYSGISRDPSATIPTVWCFGMAGNTSHQWSNFIAQVSTQNAAIGTQDVNQNLNSKAIVFPNPVVDYFNIKLNIPEDGHFEVKLFDVTGKCVSNLMNEKVLKGENIFSFNRATLGNGTYFVKFSLNNKIIHNEKILIHN